MTIRRPTAFHTFTGRDVPWLVDMQARLRPDKICLIWESFAGSRRTWTYAEFAEETLAYAAGLAAQGITADDTVVLHLENCPEFLFAWHACARVGALVVTTNTNSSADEFRYFLSHCGAVAAITQPSLLPTVKQAGPELRWIACTATDADVEPATPLDAESIAFGALRGSGAQAPRRAPEPLRPNSVQYTSGTTARPKGVVWTHANALWAGRVGSSHMRLTEDDNHMIYFPLFHTNGLAYSHLATFWSGGTAVLLPRFSASRFWDIAVRNRVTWVSHVVFTLRALAETPDPAEHHFRFWVAGSDNSLVRRRWGIESTGLFGMTETVIHNLYNEHGIPGIEGSMGVVTPEYEVSIRREDGSEVAFGETGRLWLRGMPGISLFAGYLHNPEATEAAFDAEGWFETGDEVMPLPNGEIFFIGRGKDMLRVGGENVAAIEIEIAIMGVDGIVEVAVVGKPDDMLDEVPVAFVVAAGETEGLAEAIDSRCRENLSAFKRPREIRFVESLPKGLLDKVRKTELRERLIGERSGPSS
jgi:crotonobetaine/carnitine-CoA ligase